jgi:hypothetical protein
VYLSTRLISPGYAALVVLVFSIFKNSKFLKKIQHYPPPLPCLHSTHSDRHAQKRVWLFEGFLLSHFSFRGGGGGGGGSIGGSLKRLPGINSFYLQSYHDKPFKTLVTMTSLSKHCIIFLLT